MATIVHSSLTNSDLHEPKGISTAAVNSVYQADGAGGGQWVNPNPHIGGYVSFDSAGPAYTLATGGTTDVVLDPTFVSTHASGFTSTATPNARMIYTGTPGVHSRVDFNCSMKQSSGGTIDVEIVVAKNGVVDEGSRVVRSATSGAWGSVAMHFDMALNTNDYIEFFLKTPGGAATILFAQMYMSVEGSVEL